MGFVSYLFWPNPGGVSYLDPHPLIALFVCGTFLLSSLALRVLRARSRSGSFRRLTQSWSRAALWFGIVGLLLVVARVEEIQYLAMRFWWVVFGGSFGLYGALQCRRARLLWYEVIPSATSQDVREKYLPHRKRSH